MFRAIFIVPTFPGRVCVCGAGYLLKVYTIIVGVELPSPVVRRALPICEAADVRWSPGGRVYTHHTHH